jgi:16S rRNA (cytidine1402-2'-O)-methyltransferase
VVFFEAPGRLCRLLEELLELWGERPAAVARELTKVHEEVFRGTLRTCLERYSQTAPRGECVLVVGGGSEARGEEAELDDR